MATIMSDKGKIIAESRHVGLDGETPQERYIKKNIIAVSVKLNKKTDADILQKLDEVESKQGYIKALIRKDIGKTKDFKTAFQSLLDEYGEK